MMEGKFTVSFTDGFNYLHVHYNKDFGYIWRRRHDYETIRLQNTLQLGRYIPKYPNTDVDGTADGSPASIYTAPTSVYLFYFPLVSHIQYKEYKQPC